MSIEHEMYFSQNDTHSTNCIYVFTVDESNLFSVHGIAKHGRLVYVIETPLRN